jgi:O-antigen/teichoic acid export membrane protein
MVTSNISSVHEPKPASERESKGAAPGTGRIQRLASQWGLPIHSLPYFLAVAATFVLVFGQSFYAAKMLGPALYGIWNIFAITYTYGLLVHAGALNALAREFPRAAAVGDDASVRELIRSAFWINVLGTVLFSTGAFFVLSLVFRSSADVTRRMLVIFAAFLLLQGWTNFLTFVLRARDQFVRLSRLILLMNCGVLLGAFLLIPRWRLEGFLLAWLAAYLLASIVFLRKSPHQLFPFPSRRVAWHLLRVGAPILMFSIAATVNWTMDRLLILKFLGVTAVGYFAVASFAVRLLTYVPDMVSQVMYPHWAVAGLSRSSGDATWSSGPFRMIFWAMPLLGGLGYYACFFIPTFLPQFAPSVAPSQVLCIGASLAGVGLFCGAFLGATGGERVAFTAQVAMLLLRLIIVGGGLLLGGTLFTASIASAVSGAVFGIVLLWVTGRHFTSRASFALNGTLPWVLCTGWLLAVELVRQHVLWHSPAVNSFETFVAATAFVLGSLFLLVVLGRQPVRLPATATASRGD